MMKQFVVLLSALLLLLSLAACGRSWTCDQCGKQFSGDAYYDMTQEFTLCEDCARTYWMPFPYQNYKW